MKQLVRNCAFAIATVGIATFGTVAPAAAGPLPYASGIVDKNGKLLAGNNLITVTHVGTGQYTIAFDSPIFGSTPAMTATVLGKTPAVPLIYSESKQNAKTTFLLVISTTLGTITPIDEAFQFTLIPT